MIDADALNIIAEEGLDLSMLAGGSHSNVVITPHAAEMARLVNAFSEKNAVNVTDIKNDPEGYAADFSMRFNVTVVLKDAKTTIAEAALRPEIIRIDSGSPAMAKAGSGDVLCGFIAGVSAVLSWELKDSVPLAVYMHGRAGSVAAQKKGVNSILARDIAEYANEAFLSASAGKEA